jgi:hypothetical protein
MTHRGVDLTVIESESRRFTHAGIPAGTGKEKTLPVTIVT